MSKILVTERNNFLITYCADLGTLGSPQFGYSSFGNDRIGNIVQLSRQEEISEGRGI